MKKKTAVKATNSVDEVTGSKEPGIALELFAYAVVNFDPKLVQVNTKRDSTVGGYGTIWLTEADCQTLHRALMGRVKRP